MSTETGSNWGVYRIAYPRRHFIHHPVIPLINQQPLLKRILLSYKTEQKRLTSQQKAGPIFAKCILKKLSFNQEQTTSMKLCTKNATASSGFTLMELMLVVGILAILAAIAFPMINASLPRYRLRAAARELAIDFKKAKVEAIKHNKVALIQFTAETVGSVDAGGSYLICVDADSNSACDPGEEIAKISMPKGIRLKNTTFTTPDNVTGYTSRGIPWNSQLGSVTVSTADSSRTYTISFSANGAVTM